MLSLRRATYMRRASLAPPFLLLSASSSVDDEDDDGAECTDLVVCHHILFGLTKTAMKCRLKEPRSYHRYDLGAPGPLRSVQVLGPLSTPLHPKMVTVR